MYVIKYGPLYAQGAANVAALQDAHKFASVSEAILYLQQQAILRGQVLITAISRVTKTLVPGKALRRVLTEHEGVKDGERLYFVIRGSREYIRYITEEDGRSSANLDDALLYASRKAAQLYARKLSSRWGSQWDNVERIVLTDGPPTEQWTEEEL